jgi:RHS repeat-associated protein
MTSYTVSRYNASGPGCETPSAQRATQNLYLYVNAPPTPTVSSNTCGPKTISLPAPPTGVKYYWQGTDSQSLLTTTEVNPSVVVGTSATYYIRSKVTSMSVWSAATSIGVTVTDPQPPSAPSVSTNTCGPKTLTRSNPSDGTTWYWQGTNASGQDMSGTAAAATYTISASGTYYIRAYLNSCWSNATAVSATVTNPGTPSTPIPSANSCGPKLLSKGTPSDGSIWYWQGTNSNGTDTSAPAASATYNVTSSNTIYLRAYLNSCWSTASSSLAVTVIDPAIPAVPIASTNACGAKTLTRANPSDGSTWYWQGTGASGQDQTAPAAASSYTITSSGTYYLRAYLSSCWSSASSVTATVTNPSTPSAPIPPSNTCGPKLLSKGTPSDGSVWYWQGTNSNGTDNSAPAGSATYNVTSSNTIYLRAYLNSCWSNSSSLAVTIIDPAIPAIPTASANLCGPKTLTRGTPSDGSTWYWQGTNTSGQDQSGTAAASTYSASAAGTQTYYLSAFKSGCWSTASSLSVSVNNPAVPQILSITSATCGPKVMTKGTPPAGVSWYWQEKNSSGQDVSSAIATSTTYTANSTGTYYLGAKDGAGCWAYRSIVVVIDPADLTVNSYDPANTLVQASNTITLGPGFFVPQGSTFSTNITVSPECNDYINWTESIAYDQSGNPIAKSRSYFDGLGNTLLGETKDYLSNKVFASQPFYDTYGTPAASSLLAPIIEKEFLYKGTFAQNSSNEKYAAKDFDLRTSGPGEVNNPLPLGKQPGSLGWYYSSNNNLEPQTPVTDFPYSRSFTQEGPDPTTSTSAGVGDAMRMGAGHEAKSERQLIGANDLTHYQALRSYFVNSSLPVTGYKYISTDPDGNKAITFIDADGRTLASAIFVGLLLDNWSYSYYNDLGQLVASVAPKGINIIYTNGVVTGDFSMPQFVTTYKYDHLGRMIETTSPDEGTSRFVYSTDGKIRFSENQEQRNASPKRFSYTNYDYLGRVIESGEYTADTRPEITVSPYVFQPHNTTSPIGTYSVLKLVDNTGFSGATRRKTQNQTHYRYSDTTFIEHDYQDKSNYTAQNNLPSGDALHNTQQNILGQVSKTWNANATTWYSYDEFGQLSWSKQLINGLGYKAVDYNYDYFGNVKVVGYQAKQSDKFYHFYEYDANQRLTIAYALDSVANAPVIRGRSSYYYYLHGPLKRVEIGDPQNGGVLQGIDYVYNIDGSLKLINNADPTLDPGQDGLAGANVNVPKDVFGQAIDYNTNDYIGAGFNEGTLSTPTTYTDKFSGLVKSIRWHSHIDNHVPRGYGFTYDNLNQMDNADWGSVSGNLGSGYSLSIAGDQSYVEDIGGYDKNGNITGLTRKGKSGSSLAAYGYTYTTNTNQLSSVSGGNLSYVYNSIGQMVQQTDAGIVTKMQYNAYGLVKQVSKVVSGVDRILQTYKYDDRGNKIVKTTYDPNTASNPEVKSTYYIYDASGNVLAIYDKPSAGSVALIELPVYGAGRIAVYKPAVATTFYEVADHLGNIRGVIGKPSTLTYTATVEDNGQPVYTNPRVQELAYFKNLTATEKQDVNMNHTAPSTPMPSPVYSAYLNWISGQSGAGLTQSIGPAIGLKVEAGDKLDMNVWAKFEKKTGTYSRPGIISAMATILGNNFVGTAAGIDVIGSATQVFNSGLTYALGTANGNGNDDVNNRPFAYLYYMRYDKSFNLITAGWQRVPTTAGFDSGYPTQVSPQQLVMPQITVDAPGYVYIFVANESENTKVWFDDLNIVHQRSNVVAGADYYPFGLAMNTREITREDYRYGYQGQFSEKDLTTGYNEFELRFYDAKIARWLSSDPFGQYYSPYLAMGNRPSSFVDPNGGISGPGPTFKAVGAFKYAAAIEGAVDDLTILEMIKSGVSGVGTSTLRAVTVSPIINQSIVDRWLSFSSTILDTYALLGMKVMDAQTGPKWFNRELNQRSFEDPIDNRLVYNVNPEGFIEGPQIQGGSVDLFGGAPVKGLKWLKGFKSAETSVTQIGNFWRLSAKVSGSRGSYTIYTKVINVHGKTVKWYHDTFSRSGKFLHRGWTEGSTKVHLWWDGFKKIGEKAGPHIPR